MATAKSPYTTVHMTPHFPGQAGQPNALPEAPLDYLPANGQAGRPRKTESKHPAVTSHRTRQATGRS